MSHRCQQQRCREDLRQAAADGEGQETRIRRRHGGMRRDYCNRQEHQCERKAIQETHPPSVPSALVRPRCMALRAVCAAAAINVQKIQNIWGLQFRGANGEWLSIDNRGADSRRNSAARRLHPE